jgi:hypothetical protein
MHQCTLAPLDLGQLPGLRRLDISVHFQRNSDAKEILRIFKHLPQLTNFAAIVPKRPHQVESRRKLAREIAGLQRSMPVLEIKLIDFGIDFIHESYYRCKNKKRISEFLSAM